MQLFIILILFIIVSILFTWLLIRSDKGEKEPIGVLWLAAGLGLAGAVVAALLEGLLPSKYIADTSQQVSGGLLMFSLSIGLIEELCKFVPLAVFIYKKRYFNEHTDGIIFFALAGLGFGLPENLLYTLQYGASTGLMRLIVTPFFHAATTSFVGYFLIKAKLSHKSLRQPILALIAVMVLHGIYDFSAFTQNGLLTIVAFMITLGMTTTMFILLMRAKELDQAEGLSVVGHNSFCRSCGFPNPKHNLYCQHCGQRA